MRISSCCAALALASSVAAAAAMQPVTDFGANPGTLELYEYVPDNLPSGRPLVVVMHGCTQTASGMASAGWNKLADEHQFAVLYPQQTSANNPVTCFNWAGEHGDPANLERGKGENQSIISMVDYAIAQHGSDTKRVYIVGFSAGGAFVAVMLATWPERFAAGAIMSGIPYRCATTVNGAYSCQSPGVSKSASQWGDLVRAAASFSGVRPPLQIWHGGMDSIVKTMNHDELVKQWTDVHGTDATADATETIGKATRSEYRAGNRLVVESYVIAGMGHATVIGDDPSGPCPSTIGAYFSDQKICSTARAAKFFGLFGGGPNGSNDNGSNDNGSNDNGSNDGDEDGGGLGDDLPSCSLDASHGGAGAAIFVIALAFAVRRRRR